MSQATELKVVECIHCDEGIVSVRTGECDWRDWECGKCDGTGERGCDDCGTRPAHDYDGPVLCMTCRAEGEE